MNEVICLVIAHKLNPTEMPPAKDSRSPCSSASGALEQLSALGCIGGKIRMGGYLHQFITSQTPRGRAGLAPRKISAA